MEFMHYLITALLGVLLGAVGAFAVYRYREAREAGASRMQALQSIIKPGGGGGGGPPEPP